MPRHAAQADDKLRLLDRLAHDLKARPVLAPRNRLGHRARAGGKLPQQGPQQFLHLGDVGLARHGDAEIACMVIFAAHVKQVPPAQAVHRLARAEQRLAQRMVRPEQRAGDVLRDLAGLVLVHPDFFLDDAALARDLRRRERRAQQHVAQHVDNQRQVRGAGPCVVTRHLFRGEGVEITADALDRLGNFPRVALGRALEEHVLEKMKHAVLPPRLLPATDREPETDGDAFDVRHVRDGELRTILEAFLAENHVPSVVSRFGGVNSPLMI